MLCSRFRFDAVNAGIGFSVGAGRKLKAKTSGELTWYSLPCTVFSLQRGLQPSLHKRRPLVWDEGLSCVQGHIRLTNASPYRASAHSPSKHTITAMAGSKRAHKDFPRSSHIRYANTVARINPNRPHARNAAMHQLTRLLYDFLIYSSDPLATQS